MTEIWKNPVRVSLSHEIDFKILTKIYRTWPKQGTRLVFEFFKGSSDFKMQKVYLLQLMPVCVGLTMVNCLFLSVLLIKSGV
jgi:hypothetical protein